MHLQFYYQLRNTPEGMQGRIHPLVAVDLKNKEGYPLCKDIKIEDKASLDAWVLKKCAGKELDPTTRAHLEIAHSFPEKNKKVANVAQWMLYAEAYTRQEKHRALISENQEQLIPWRQWLDEQELAVHEFPRMVQSYFEGCSMGSDALLCLMEGPGVDWTTALMSQMNPTCKVDPTGRGHDSAPLQPRVMANNGKYGWTLSYGVTHLDYSKDKGAVQAKATKCTATAQRDESGKWQIKNEKRTFDAFEWWDGLLLTTRHNKDVKLEVLEKMVATAIAAGIPHTEIVKSELPRTLLKGASMSKRLLEVVLKEPWERIEQQVTLLEGLGYKEELPLYLWIFFQNKEPMQAFDLPALT